MTTYSDESIQPPIQKRIGIWDDRPRFLGMFRAYKSKSGQDPLPIAGVLDHLHTCPHCDPAKAPPHPELLAVCAFVRFGAWLVTISAPTWLPESMR